MSFEEPPRFEPGAAPGATSFRCALCGLDFTHGGRACAACALGAGCHLVKCPRCGYQFPRESRLVELARRLARRLRRTS